MYHDTHCAPPLTPVCPLAPSSSEHNMMPNRTHPNQRTEGEKKPFLHYCFLLASKRSLRPPERGSPLLPPLSSRRGGNPALDEEKTLSDADAADAIVRRSVERRKREAPCFYLFFFFVKGAWRESPMAYYKKSNESPGKEKMANSSRKERGEMGPFFSSTGSFSSLPLFLSNCNYLLLPPEEESDGFRRGRRGERTKKRMCPFHSPLFSCIFKGKRKVLLLRVKLSSKRVETGDASFLSLSFRR